jgi:hypothetical protein
MKRKSKSITKPPKSLAPHHAALAALYPPLPADEARRRSMYQDYNDALDKVQGRKKP